MQTSPAESPPTVGGLLRRWRTARRMSQLDLALAAEVSARHLSFLETGRARPSRQMLLVLGSVLDLPLRERNALLRAAGFSGAYPETPLDEPRMAAMRGALELILRQHEPFGAVAMDRHWNVVMMNAAYARFARALLGASLPPFAVLPEPRPNAMRLLFDPRGFRPHVVNWNEVARELLARVQREALWSGDPGTKALLADLLAAPAVPADWREPDVESAPSLVVPVALRLGAVTVRFFTTLTTLGAPQDITLQELRIESFHAANEETERVMRAMGG
ncbi:MAG TPA: helix-turn-helix transcriptional regulator [Candidatus Limnocylindrales bacterium]|nr:helix-turn-helix transcriptional regulator [Candidatus Limnocylindrales bacterium]